MIAIQYKERAEPKLAGTDSAIYSHSPLCDFTAFWIQYLTKVSTNWSVLFLKLVIYCFLQNILINFISRTLCVKTIARREFTWIFIAPWTPRHLVQWVISAKGDPHIRQRCYCRGFLLHEAGPLNSSKVMFCSTVPKEKKKKKRSQPPSAGLPSAFTAPPTVFQSMALMPQIRWSI